jgi:hypothetical protein
MKVKELKIDTRNPYPATDPEIKDLVNSIKEFPEMMKYRPIIYDPKTMTPIAGNKRLRALQILKYDEIPEGWAISASDLTDAQKKRFKIADNVNHGAWDLDIVLEDYSEDEAKSWGIEIPKSKKKNATFQEKFNGITDDDAKMPIVPDFMEDYNAFIIVTKNEIDEIFIRNLFKIAEPTHDNQHGLSKRLTNVITVEMIKEALKWEK